MSSRSGTTRRPPAKKPKIELSKTQQIDKYFSSFEPQKQITLPVKMTKSTTQKTKLTTGASNTKMDRYVTTRSSAAMKSQGASTSKNIGAGLYSSKLTATRNGPNISPTRKSARNLGNISSPKTRGDESMDRTLQELDRSTTITKSKKIPLSKANEERMAEELERLANENLGDLCKFPSDDDDDESSPSLNSSQKSGLFDRYFIGRAKELIQSKELSEVAERDVLNIRIDFAGLRNLCRAKNFYVITGQSRGMDALSHLPATNFELLFLLSPTHKSRKALLYDFYRQFGQTSSPRDRATVAADANKKRLSITPQQIITILQFIGQLADEGVESSGSYNGNSSQNSAIFAPLFEQNVAENQLFKISEAAYWKAVEENRIKSNSQTINWNNHRKEVCLENLCLFCSILPFLELAEWRSRDICSFLVQICGVYVDEIVIEIRPKISSAIELLIYSLPAEKAKKVISNFLKRMAALSIDFRALFLVVSALVRLQFFASPAVRFEFLSAVFARVTAETSSPNAVTSTTDGCSTEASSSSCSASLSLADSRPSREATPGIIKLFAVFPDIAQALIERPTDFYIAMQMLDLCVTDAVISKEYSETLCFLSESLKTAKDCTKNVSRMDEIILRSMSDVAHRIGLVIHRRRATAYENCDTARYSMFSSSSSSSDDEVEEEKDESIQIEADEKYLSDEYIL